MAGQKKSRLGMVIAIGVVVVLAGGGAGGYFLYTRTEAKQQARREQAFADISQCLFGERVDGADGATTAITSMQARGGHLPDAARWPDQGVAWPQRCGTYAKDLQDAARESSFLDSEPKRILMKDASDLAVELAMPGAQTGFLAQPIAALWKDALSNNLAMAKQSSVKGPPKTERIGVTFDELGVPFANLLPVSNGPVWHFLVTRSDKKDKLGSCVPTEAGLTCKEFESDLGFVPQGSWESAAYIPQNADGAMRILHDGKLDDPNLPYRAKVHVGATGTVYALALDVNDKGDALQKLSIIEPGREPKKIDVGKALDKRVDKAKDIAMTATLLGQGIVVVATKDGKDVTLRFPINSDGSLGEGVEIPKSLPCRIGDRYAFRETPDKIFSFLKGDKMEDSIPMPATDEQGPKNNWTCSASGSMQLGSRRLCRPKPVGCVEVLDKESFDIFAKTVQHLPLIDSVGDRIVYTWGAKDGSGLLVHVGDPGFVAAGRDVLVVDKTGGKGPSKMGVFGGEKVAVAIADIEGKLIGFKIGADGQIGPLVVTWQ